MGDPNYVGIAMLRRTIRVLLQENPLLKGKLSKIPINIAENLGEKYYRNRFLTQKTKLKLSDERVNNAYNQAIHQDSDYDEDEKLEGTRSPIKKYTPGKLLYQAKKTFGQGYEKLDLAGTLYNDQIDKVMSRFKDYAGTIMRDQIKTLLPHIKPQSRIAFIINTDDHTKPGQHWDAIYIDATPNGSHSLEWFDSFGRPMPPDILEDCKLILHCLKPETLLKIKENKVVHQKDSTSNCGFFCMKFLIDRFRGKSFADASGYDDRVKINHASHDEKEIEKFKKMPQFSYI